MTNAQTAANVLVFDTNGNQKFNIRENADFRQTSYGNFTEAAFSVGKAGLIPPKNPNDPSHTAYVSFAAGQDEAKENLGFFVDTNSTEIMRQAYDGPLISVPQNYIEFANIFGGTTANLTKDGLISSQVVAYDYETKKVLEEVGASRAHNLGSGEYYEVTNSDIDGVPLNKNQFGFAIIPKDSSDAIINISNDTVFICDQKTGHETGAPSVKFVVPEGANQTRVDEYIGPDGAMTFLSVLWENLTVAATIGFVGQLANNIQRYSISQGVPNITTTAQPPYTTVEPDHNESGGENLDALIAAGVVAGTALVAGGTYYLNKRYGLVTRISNLFHQVRDDEDLEMLELDVEDSDIAEEMLDLGRDDPSVEIDRDPTHAVSNAFAESVAGSNQRQQ